MRIVCQQTILMKYHALFVIFEKAAKFDIVVCCKLEVALYGLRAYSCSLSPGIHMQFRRKLQTRPAHKKILLRVSIKEMH